VYIGLGDKGILSNQVLSFIKHFRKEVIYWGYWKLMTARVDLRIKESGW
jgi:hypothetical protein